VTDRTAALWEHYQQTKSLDATGKAFGITGTRVLQLLCEAGHPTNLGTRAKIVRPSEKERAWTFKVTRMTTVEIVVNARKEVDARTQALKEGAENMNAGLPQRTEYKIRRTKVEPV
jgi:hypothetical protein